MSTHDQCPLTTERWAAQPEVGLPRHYGHSKLEDERSPEEGFECQGQNAGQMSIERPQEYHFANRPIEAARANVAEDIQRAREAGHPIPEDPNRAVSRTLEAHGLLRYPSRIPEPNVYISARINNSDDRFPGFNYGTFVVTQEGDVAFAKLRYGPKNTEQILVEGELVDAQVGGLYCEAQVLTELTEQGYETPSLLGYFPETPRGAKPDRADTLETLLIEAILPQEGSTLPPEKWSSELARLAARKIESFTTPTSETPLFQNKERSLPLDILIRRARLPANGDYELALKKAVEKYEHLDPPIVTHGDTWLNNIIVKYDSSDLLFVDWELAGPGYKGQDAGRTLWGLTLDTNWDFVDVNDTARAFIYEWSQSEDEKNVLRFGILFESLRWIADRQDRLLENTLSTGSKRTIVKRIEDIKAHALELLVHIPEN